MYSNRSSLSPEVTSKGELQPEEFEDNIKTLSEKLSAALRNISLKEDLVQQHSKVAEEAVEGIKCYPLLYFFQKIHFDIEIDYLIF